MKLLKNIALNLVLGLNVFILFFLLFEDRIVLPAFLQVLGRMHPLLLHFPIVLLILALVSELFGKHLQAPPEAAGKAGGVLLLASALTAALTVVFGLILSKEDGYGGSTMAWHKWTGVAISLSSAILFWYRQRQRPNLRIFRAGLGLTCLTLLIAGHLGASLTHGENFVLEPLIPTRTQPVDPKTAVLFKDLVLPVLREKCFSCHNTDKAKGDLVLTDTASILKGGKDGALFVAGQPGESLLMERLLMDIGHKHHMPPKNKPQLEPAELALINAWIASGASFSVKLADLPPSDTLHTLAKAIYGEQQSSQRETFTFPPADEAVISRLNNSYRVIAPLAIGSPALDVSFFNGSVFKRSSLEELQQIAPQVVYLNLSGMPLENADLELLKAFGNLRQLNLNYTPVTDEGLPALGALSQLHSLMLTGTGVTAAGIDSLVKLPQLKNLYVWNTEITEEQAKKWASDRPGLAVETGYYDDGSLILPLNEPVINPPEAFFREPFEMTLSHPIGGTELRYTLDGSEPDSLSSPLFSKPIPITGNTLVKVRAFKKGWLGSKTVQLHFHKAAIQPDSVALETTPENDYAARGGRSLFDRSNGSLDRRDGEWLGYRGTQLVAKLLFKEPTHIHEVALNTLVFTSPHVFPPSAIEVWGGKEEGNMELLGSLRPEMPREHWQAATHIYTCPLKKREVTVMRIVVRSVKAMPSWHQASGKPALVLVDEILLN